MGLGISNTFNLRVVFSLHVFFRMYVFQEWCLSEIYFQDW